MIGFNYGPLTLAVLSTIGLMACAPPPVDEFEGMDKSRKRATAEADDDDDDDPDSKGPGAKTGRVEPSASNPGDPPNAPSAGDTKTGGAAAEPPTLRVTFALAARHTYAGATVFRVCSDRGAHHQNATFIDGTSLKLVSVDAPDRVLATVSGAAFETMKARMLDPASGVFEVPIKATDLTTQPQEFALIMGGDDRFRSPTDCKTSLKPKSAAERDVEEFPNANVMAFNTKIGGSGCGIVGFVEARFDPAQQKVIAVPSSQLLLAADDEGRAGFPKGNYYPACDGHDSPLVLDLGERGGVSLSAPVANVFDVDGDGHLDDSPWISSDDTPFLVHDVNGNGVVDGIDEMFGNRTRTSTTRANGANGTQFRPQNGFEALAVWDDTSDGAIDRKDAIWSSLRLWFDRNHDGRTDPGELETLEARGVRSVALSFVSVKENLLSSGQLQGAVRQRGGATMTDGRIVSVVDVWFHRRF